MQADNHPFSDMRAPTHFGVGFLTPFVSTFLGGLILYTLFYGLGLVVSFFPCRFWFVFFPFADLKPMSAAAFN